jgi:hypothetical protein
MFERYTEKARRVIFFARYEASQFGSPYIETEHLLLGLLREDKALTNRFLRSHASVESIRKQIEGHTTIREKVSTSVDLPLSNECKRVLAYAAEEAERLSHKHIGTEHLLLGLLREEKCFAAEILHERGLRVSTIREELARGTQEKNRAGVDSTSVGAETMVGGIVPPSCSFVSGDAVIACVPVLSVGLVPRVGERVVLKDNDGKELSYRVEEPSYEYERDAEYEREAPDMVVAPHQLANVLIRVKPE